MHHICSRFRQGCYFFLAENGYYAIHLQEYPHPLYGGAGLRL